MLQQELEVERSLNESLTRKCQELNFQHCSDSDVTMHLRKRIIKLESDLMDTVSKFNDKKSGEEAVMSRLRTLLEKSEASRHQTEYELLVEQKQGRELKEEMEATEERHNEEVQRYKDLVKEAQSRAKEWEKAVGLAHKASEMEQENMAASTEKLKAVAAEKDQIIEFLNFESDEKRKCIEDLTKSLEVQKKECEKSRSKLEKCERAWEGDKETLRQTLLKVAVMEQREQKLKEELAGCTEDRRRVDENLQRERGLNIQNAQQLAAIEEELVLIERSKEEFKGTLAKEQAEKERLSGEVEKLRAQVEELETERTKQDHTIARSKREVEKRTEEAKRVRKEKDREIEVLLSDLSRHQSICGELAEELSSLQSGMDQIEAQYGEGVRSLESLYRQQFPGGGEKVESGEMSRQLAIRLHDLLAQNLKQAEELNVLQRTVNQNSSVIDVQKSSLDTKAATITSLQAQLSELRSGQVAGEGERAALADTNRTLQQQLQDMSSLLATEQEKALTLLKDKKEIIKQKHESLKGQCETLAQIGEVLGHTSGRESEWSEVCAAVMQAARNAAAQKRDLNTLLKEAHEEIQACHVSMETLSKNVDSARVQCARKLAENEGRHSEHSKTLESNFLQLVETLNNKLKASEASRHSTQEELLEAKEGMKELTRRASVLEEDLTLADQRRVSFQAAVGMLASTVLHHMNSYNRALYVLAFYKQQVAKGEEKLRDLRNLSHALTDTPSTPRHAIFTFRRGVIVVLAALRLQALGKTHRHKYILGVPTDTNPIQWLESSALERLVSGAVKNWRTRPLAATTDKLVASIYNNTHTLDVEMYGDSLLCEVAGGLKTLWQSYTLPNDVALVRSFTLNLTQRLHSVELERRSLLSKMQHWQKEAGELKGAVEQTEILSRRVKELEGVAFKTVPIEKHESVMKELAGVMGREESLREEAHSLRQQLKRLGEDYESASLELRERSETLDEAIKDLSNQKVQLRQCEQAERSSTRKLTALEGERRSLLEQLATVQKTVDSRSRDRDCLHSYLSKLSVALQERKIRVTSGNLATVSGFLSVGENTTEEVEEVQKICALYEDILRLVQRRITGLERDVRSFKNHTDSLKGELSAACQRLTLDDLPLAKPLVGSESGGHCNENFVPLKLRPQELGSKIGNSLASTLDML